MTSRVDGPLKVTGRARYGADNSFPGMAYGYLVVSTIANGEIEAMDVTAAESAPGVIGVYSPFSPLDLRPVTTPLFGETWVPLQDKEVVYYGQPIGLVVAETYEQARDAAMTVGVSYHRRPAQTSLEAGLSSAEDAPPGRDGSPCRPRRSPSSRPVSSPLRTPWRPARWSSRPRTAPRRRTMPRWSRIRQSRCGTTTA
jgi:xanthine dehydrogenase YagR molybdenum-binding subunit